MGGGDVHMLVIMKKSRSSFINIPVQVSHSHILDTTPSLFPRCMCPSHNFSTPSFSTITSLNNLSPSTANLTIFPARSSPFPSSGAAISLTNVPLSQTTAKATYPGLRFGVEPPVGPAVPLSQSVYVLSKSFLTWLAMSAQICGVGPRYALIVSCVQPA